MAVLYVHFSPCFKLVGVQFTTRERFFMIKVFVKSYNSYETKRRYQGRSPNRNLPSVRTIRHNRQKYLIRGTSKNRNKANAGRHHSGRTPQNIAATWRDIQRNPSVSTWKNNAPVSKTSFNGITINYRNIHPYQVHTHQAVEARDPLRRIAFCQRLLNMATEVCPSYFDWE